MVLLDGTSLTLEQLLAIADHGATVALAGAARDRVRASRAVVDRRAQGDEPAYGINTGFGSFADVKIAPEALETLQLNLLRSHAAGLGDPLPVRAVRATMALRATVLATGFSGISVETLDALIALLNRGVHPRVPSRGSVGASGDLAPLAHLALSLIGEGDLHHGATLGAASALLSGAGLAPLVLAPKEGITLINGTQAHTAVAALAVADARTLWHTAHVSGGASLEALLGTPAAFDPRIQDARGQEGQRDSAALLRALLAGSEIRESHREGDRRVQDAYALRCMPQVHGPVLDAIRFAEGVIGCELNAATDNPLVFDDGTMLSGGNFHGQAVAMVLDFLAIAMTNLATIAERRIDRVVHPDLNEGLPPFLARDAGLHSGFMMAQVTAAALASECKVLSHPASVDTIPTDGNKEDVVPMAMGAAWKLRRIIGNVQHILAIELMCAAQGIEYRRPLRAGHGVEAAYERIRALVAPLGDDRVLSGDIQRLAAAVAAKNFVIAS